MQEFPSNVSSCRKCGTGTVSASRGKKRCPNNCDGESRNYRTYCEFCGSKNLSNDKIKCNNCSRKALFP